MRGKLKLALMACLVVACSKEGISPERNLDYTYGRDLSHERIVLGDRLENPYKTENISAALKSLYPTKADNMQDASFYAGRAFTRGCVGYVHAVGHTLGGLYGVPHGLAMSVILPHVMRQFGPAAHERLARLAEVCGMDGADDAEKAEKFIKWIEDLKHMMNIPVGIDVIQDKDVNQIIKWAMKEANPLYPTPVTWKKKDFQ